MGSILERRSRCVLGAAKPNAIACGVDGPCTRVHTARYRRPKWADEQLHGAEELPSLWDTLSGTPILSTGGRQGKLPVTAFESFDLETRTWTRHPSLPSRRAFAGCAMAEGNVFSLGGLQQPGPHNFYSRPHFVNTVEMFDLEHGKQWQGLLSLW